MTRSAKGAAVLAACVCSILIGGWAGTATAQTVPWDPNAPAPVSQPPSSPLSSQVGASAQAAPQIPSGVAVGRTPGSFSVSSTGQATYSVPIFTPKGIAGLTPSLNLVYSSASGDGLYGVGWTVSGFSSITRCQKTWGQDTASANVFLTSSDLFCLDGNKLRSFSGTYGHDLSQYQTEIANFSLVISHGQDSSGTGPLWFEVHGKNGLTYQYGNTAHSALLATSTNSVITWALNRITDRFGNYIDFDYYNDPAPDQELRPYTVTYTTPGTTGVQATPNYQVTFAYEGRGTATTPGGFVTGAQYMEPFLVQTITVGAYNGSTYPTVRSYNLTYTTNTATTGRAQLTSIQECSATQCFSPTSVSYQNGTGGWSSAVATGGASQTLNNAFVVDLNGDGVDDIVYQNASNVWSYMLGSTNGSFQGPYTLGFTPVAPIDFNSDGKMDLLTVNSSTGHWRVMSFTSPGNSNFSITETAVPAPTNASIGYVIVGDVDGDGRDDIIYAVSSGSTNWTTPDHIYYRLRSGSDFGGETLLFTIGTSSCSVICTKLTAVPFGQYTPYNSRIRRLDVNGDGRIDFFANTERCVMSGGNCNGSPTFQWNLFVSDANTVSYDQLDVLSYGAEGLTSNLTPPLVGDFNGDGCTDVATPQVVNNQSQWVIQYGTCLRSGATFALSAGVATGVTPLPGYPLAIDWDGDGLDDIVQSSTATGGTLYYAKSTGTSLNAFVSTGIPYNNGDPYSILPVAVVADTNGDGLYEILFPTTSGYAVDVLPHKGATVTPDLAISFTDGFGINYSPSYLQLTNTNIYLKGSGAVFPEQDIRPSTTVVSSYTGSDGIGGTYTVSKEYSQARMNVQRRQFEGFSWNLSIDSRDGLYRYILFGQTFPVTGLLSAQRTLQSDNTTYISDIENTLTYATLDATYKRSFPYVSQSVATTYEFGGSLNGTLITQKTTVPSFSGPNGFKYGNPSKIVTTTVDKDPTSPWPNNPTFTNTLNITPYETAWNSSNSTGWCIHLATGTSEQRTQPNSSSLTHTTSYDVDHSNDCAVHGKTVERGGSGFSDTGIRGSRPGHSRRNEIHEEAQT